jgi:hypothetical protein
VFRQGVVHGDDGVFQHAVFLHGAQADDASGGFLGAADDLRQLVPPSFMATPSLIMVT